MKNIPFPNPHDADALNTWLDALADGKQAPPDSDVESAAHQFHVLARRAEPASQQQSLESVKGPESMHTATLTAPISNRTRRQREAEKAPRRSYGWLSAIIVAGLMISMLGSAWLNRPGGDPNNNLAFAPATVEATPDSDVPWTQPISPSECPADSERNAYDPDNPGNTMYTQDDYDQVSPERSYEIVGTPAPEDAAAVVNTLRESYGCIAMGKTRLMVTARWEYENRTTAGRKSVEDRGDERVAASESVSGWLESDLGLTPVGMYVLQDPDELELDGTEALFTQGLYNPAHAVLFADGRIGVIFSAVSYSGFPMEVNEETVPGYAPSMSIFVNQDGQWMLDESLPICLGDCSQLGQPLASPTMIDGDVPGEKWGETRTDDPIATPED